MSTYKSACQGKKVFRSKRGTVAAARRAPAAEGVSEQIRVSGRAMSSLLLRSSAVRRALSAASREHGPSFRRAISAAATASGGGLEAAVARGPTLPYRCRNLTVHSREKDDKTDLERKHLQELEQMFQQIFIGHVKLHRFIHSSDRDYFDRFLSKLGWPRCKRRDVFVFRCKLATIFVASVMSGYMLPE